MVRLFEQQFPYDHSWSTTTIGLWLKYPNPYSPHVLSIDVLSRSVNVDTGVLRTERLVGVKQAIPRWIMRLLGVVEEAFIREVIYVDPVNQITSMASINLSLSQYMQVVEMISYTPSLTSPTTQTLFSQRAHISSPPSGCPGYAPTTGDGEPLSNGMIKVLKRVGNKLESGSVDRFGENAEKGRMGFTGVLDEVKKMLEERKAEVGEVGEVGTS